MSWTFIYRLPGKEGFGQGTCWRVSCLIRRIEVSESSTSLLSSVIIIRDVRRLTRWGDWTQQHACRGRVFSFGRKGVEETRCTRVRKVHAQICPATVSIEEGIAGRQRNDPTHGLHENLLKQEAENDRDIRHKVDCDLGNMPDLLDGQRRTQI